MFNALPEREREEGGRRRGGGLEKEGRERDRQTDRQTGRQREHPMPDLICLIRALIC